MLFIILFKCWTVDTQPVSFQIKIVQYGFNLHNFKGLKNTPSQNDIICWWTVGALFHTCLKLSVGRQGACGWGRMYGLPFLIILFLSIIFVSLYIIIKPVVISPPTNKPFANFIFIILSLFIIFFIFPNFLFFILFYNGIYFMNGNYC